MSTTRLLPLAALVAVLLVACAAPPGATPASFELTVPPSVTLGQPFELTVRAVGSDGSSPLTGFDGSVALGSDRGLLITPGFEALVALELRNGSGTVEAVLLGESGEIALGAEAGGVDGSATLDVAPLLALPGDPGDPAEEAIPDLPYLPRDDDFSDDHPDLTGVAISFNTLALVFELGTTVGEANALLAAEGAEIVGGVAGRAGSVEGVLLLRLPTGDHGEMIARIDDLRTNSAVMFAVQDSVLEVITDEGDPDPLAPAALPRPNGGSPPNWTWELTPTGGNWGFERTGVPQMWNLNAALAKRHPGVATRPITAILDVGFTDPPHEDVGWINRSPGSVDEHGVHVAGIVHARHDNGVGVDGVNPFTTLRVRDYKLIPGVSLPGTSFFDRRRSFGQIVTGTLILVLFNDPEVRVLNLSLGYNWARGGVNTDTNTAAKNLASAQGGALAVVMRDLGPDAPIITAAAGNDSNDLPDGSGGFIVQQARWASPFTNAALEHGASNIIVVESFAIDGARSTFSNPGGHVSAPGSAILSTSLSPLYETKSGTSMAAPFVAGLVGYLYALDPDLTHLQILSLLRVNGRPVTDDASDAIDAFASALDIDRIRGNDAVLRMLLDIDDGTADGNQRTVIGSVGAGGDGDDDGLADGALDSAGPLFATLTDFEGEDGDGDGGIGDGRIDMADFRRWRDWLLQIENAGDLDLDGSNGNTKRDVNDDNRVQGAAKENVFPRGDFNGDGVLSRTATAQVPGAVDALVTDLQVLERLFDDPDVPASALDGLLDSMDLTVWPKGCYDLDGFSVDLVVSSVHPMRIVNDLLEPALFERAHDGKEAPEIYTLPLVSSAAPQGYTIRVEAFENGDRVGAFEADLPDDLPLGLGGDVVWDACDPRPTLTSVTGSRSSLTAIEGPDDVFTEVEFTLAFEDAGKNIATIAPLFTLGGTVIPVPPLDVDHESVDGFAGVASGGGTVLFDLLVFCSEAGESPMVATFQLIDAFGQVSEERSFDLEVDYGNC